MVSIRCDVVLLFSSAYVWGVCGGIQACHTRLSPTTVRCCFQGAIVNVGVTCATLIVRVVMHHDRLWESVAALQATVGVHPTMTNVQVRLQTPTVCVAPHPGGQPENSGLWVDALRRRGLGRYAVRGWWRE
jgi:hypothetical protein